MTLRGSLESTKRTFVYPALMTLSGIIGALIGWLMIPNVFSSIVFAIFGMTLVYMFVIKE